MPSSWTEPQVEASLTATVGVAGRTICVKVPDDWRPGRTVRLLLLPDASTKPAAPKRVQGQETNPG